MNPVRRDDPELEVGVMREDYDPELEVGIRRTEPKFKLLTIKEKSDSKFDLNPWLRTLVSAFQNFHSTGSLAFYKWVSIAIVVSVVGVFTYSCASDFSITSSSTHIDVKPAGPDKGEGEELNRAESFVQVNKGGPGFALMRFGCKFVQPFSNLNLECQKRASVSNSFSEPLLHPEAQIQSGSSSGTRCSGGPTAAEQAIPQNTASSSGANGCSTAGMKFESDLIYGESIT